MTRATEWIGRTLNGAYRLDQCLAAGGMGAIFVGEQLAVGRRVAVKMLQGLKELDPKRREEVLARFKREAVATSSLTHPNTVRLIDFGQDKASGELFLVLEYLEGESLADVMDRDCPIDVGRVARIGEQIANSLTEAHALGIVHRDIKPANVLVSTVVGNDEFVKLLDFGIAAITNGDPSRSGGRVTQRHEVMGSPVYMSPEQVEGRLPTPGTDVYSLGILLYEMACGVPPFDGDTDMAIMVARLRDRPPMLILPPNVSATEVALWRELIDRMLSFQPHDRPSPVEVRDQLLMLADLADRRVDGTVEEVGVPATARPQTRRSAVYREQVATNDQTPVAIVDPPKRRSGRSRWIGAALASVGVAAAAIAIAVVGVTDGGEPAERTQATELAVAGAGISAPTLGIPPPRRSLVPLVEEQLTVPPRTAVRVALAHDRWAAGHEPLSPLGAPLVEVVVARHQARAAAAAPPRAPGRAARPAGAAQGAVAEPAAPPARAAADASKKLPAPTSKEPAADAVARPKGLPGFRSDAPTRTTYE